MNEQFHAYAYTGSRVIKKFSGDDQNTVVQQLKEALHEHMEELKNRRDADGVPCTEEYREAIESIKDEVSQKQIALLKIHARKSGNKITIKDLMHEAGCNTLGEADSLYARVGRTLSIFLDFKPQAEELPLPLKAINVIAIPQGQRSEGLWEWTLRPQVVEALEEARV
ncbi:MAG: hypothetical protein ACK4NR_12070 [Micavibrio sp.]